MLGRNELRVILLHEFKLGRNAAQTYRNVVKAWGEEATSERTVRRWFEKFRSGDTSLQDEEGRGRPSAIDDDVLKATVEANPRVTVRELAKQYQVSVSTISEHLHQLGKVKKLDTWVPHELTEQQKQRRYEICSNLLLRNENEPILDRIVTCDEKWVLYDNRKRSGQWLNHDEPPKQHPKAQLTTKKVLLTVWWTLHGVVHYRFLNAGETINSVTYCAEIDRMHQKLCSKQPSLVNRKGPLLLHDNAKPHVSQMTKQKLHDLRYETLPHPAYSPDLAPTDFHFFMHLTHYLKDRTFRNREEAVIAFRDFLASREPDFFRTGIAALVTRWQRCVAAEGAYFE